MDNKELELKIKTILSNSNIFDMLVEANNFKNEYKKTSFYKKTKIKFKKHCYYKKKRLFLSLFTHYVNIL